MIVGLRGVLEGRGTDWVHVRVGGVTLQVWVPATDIPELGGPGQEVYLHTHLQVKEDSLALYGFAREEALRMFHTLQEVSGVGARLALNMLSAMKPEALAQAIVFGDEKALAKVPGVGKRTAARVVLELKDKLRREGVATGPSAPSSDDGEVVAALVALGYSTSEARQAAASTASEDGLSLEERVRRALRHLAGGG